MRGPQLSGLKRELAKLKAEADARLFLPRMIARQIRAVAEGHSRDIDWAIAYHRDGIPPEVVRVDPDMPRLVAAIAEREGPAASTVC